MIEEEPVTREMVKEIKDNESEYKRLINIGIYSEDETISKLGIFCKSSCDVLCNVVFAFDGTKYNSRLKNEISIYMVRVLFDEIPKLKNKFSIAYIHSSFSSFLFLKRFMQLLPADHLAKLSNFYIVDPSFIVNLIQKFSFGAINNYLDRKVIYVESAEELQQKLKISLGGNVIKSKIKLEQHQLAHRTTKQFDNSTIQIVRDKFYGKDLSNYQVSSDKIPLLVQLLVVRLYSSSNLLQAEGIMRKNCDIEQLEILEQKIMQNLKFSVIQQFSNPYVLSGCLKKIFNNLYSPLFSYELYERISGYNGDGNKENNIIFAKSCLAKMESLNKRVLLYMLAFLKKGIILNHEINKMPAYNISVVFGPCFFRPKVYRLEDLMNSARLSGIILLLLENFEEIVGEQAYSFYSLLDEQKLRYAKQ